MQSSYIKSALVTEPKSYAPVVERFTEDFARVDHAVCGLETELGELRDILKRHLYYGKEIDFTHIVEETGDLCWYMAILFSYIESKTGRNPESILLANINKLRTRYPDGFKEFDALNRDLPGERIQLQPEVKCDAVNFRGVSYYIPNSLLSEFVSQVNSMNHLAESGDDVSSTEIAFFIAWKQYEVH